MKRTVIAVAALGLALAGCGGSSDAGDAVVAGESSPTAEHEGGQRSAGVHAPGEKAKSETYGVTTEIVAIGTEETSSGPATVITFELHNESDELFEDYNWPTPQVSYGAKGIQADSRYNLMTGLGDGVLGAIPPGGARTVRHGYAMDIAEMSDATISVGSLIWRGDFTPLATAAEPEAVPEQAAAEPAPAAAPTPQAPSPEPRWPVGYTGAPVGDPQPLVGKVIDYCMGAGYQTGTTQFTDGTTGWTTECAG